MALVDIIKWDSLPGTLGYKFPQNAIRLGSQLVVYPGQTAFFVKGGQILDEFKAGTYTITTENIPLLSGLINLPFGHKSPFQAEVWFINTLSLLDFKWGTATPIQIEDPLYKVIVPIRSYGQYGLKIQDPRMFLEKLVGNMPLFNSNTLSDYFRGLILSKLTNIITHTLYEKQLSVININSNVEMLSSNSQEKLRGFFEEYGLSLEMFVIIAINVDESDASFLRLKETKDSLARIEIMGKKNYTIERSFNVLESAAENEGNGLIGAAIGIGAGFGIGNLVNDMAKNNFNIPPLTQLNSDTQYYLGINGKLSGPFKHSEITTSLQTGTAFPDTLIWKKGLTQWVKISDLPEFSYLSECPPPLPPTNK